MPAETFPILEFDPAREAILNPQAARRGRSVPRKAVLCFFQDVLTDLVNAGRLAEIGALKSEIGRNPLYALEQDGQRLLVLHPGVGAPLAAGFLEEAIGLGARSFIACGGCGVLRPDIAAGHVVILSAAVRDEGTSYHYLPPGREVSASPAAISALERVLQREGIPWVVGKSWTTDAIYRESAARREQRVAEGCDVVEMEAAAFFAVAQFRGVSFGQVVYGGDLVVPEGWDERDWYKRKDDRHRLFWLAAAACAELE